ncbi:DNA-binding transcriptional regulator MelR [compost metagenome]
MRTASSTREKLSFSIASLRCTESSVMDISLMLGYSQASAFSHAFRQFRGLSPADYRKFLAMAEDS